MPFLCSVAIPSSTLRAISMIYIRELPVSDSVSLEEGRPIQYTVLVDKLGTAGHAKQAFLKALRLEASFENVTMFEMKGQTVVSSLGDSDSLRHFLPSDGSIAVYIQDPKPSYNMLDCFVLQRRIAVSTTTTASGKQTLKASLCGYPLLLQIEDQQNCARARVSIWHQVKRMIDEQSTLGMAIVEMEKQGKHIAQLHFARILPIRLVDSIGRGRSSPALAARAVEPFSAIYGDQVYGLDGGLGLDLSNLGALMPFSKDISVAEWTGISHEDRSFVFLSVDWSGDWYQHALNTPELDAKITFGAAGTGNPSPLKEPLSGTSITLEQCLREHTREEVLDTGNEWYCGVCKEHKKATKKVKFWRERLPKVLILSLKRFEFRDVSRLLGGGGNRAMTHRDKIDAFVDFPLDGLDMSPFCEEEDSIVDGSCAVGRSPPPPCLYDLFAVCNHYGKLGFGHYTAIARDWLADDMADQWHTFDDDHVMKCISEDQVKSNAAYIFFYRRRG
jgi:Ubiquitin carboxyl-terminal hydrolase